MLVHLDNLKDQELLVQPDNLEVFLGTLEPLLSLKVELQILAEPMTQLANWTTMTARYIAFVLNCC